MRSLRWMDAVVVVGVAAVAGYCWIAAGLRPFTLPIAVAVAIPEVAMAGVAWRRRVRGNPPAVSIRREAVPWVTLLVVLAAWELTAYFSSPRQEHPTLSSIADSLGGTHVGRAALFAVWLLLGWALFGSRAP